MSRLHRLRTLVRTWLVIAIWGSFVAPVSAHPFEVWLVDQSNSHISGGYGGRIYTYDGEQVSGDDAATATPTDVIDLAGATDALCMTLPNPAHPVRPHMLLFNSSHTHAILSFVASGHMEFVCVSPTKARTSRTRCEEGKNA